jgi:hypothetical protein
LAQSGVYCIAPIQRPGMTAHMILTSKSLN